MKSDTTAFVNAQWRKSTRSDANGGACVEVAVMAGIVGVRDTKDEGSGPILTFAGEEWAAFISGVKDGEFNL